MLPYSLYATGQLVNVTTSFGEAGSGWACKPLNVSASMEVISPFFITFRLYVRMRLLAERISKHSAKGNIAGGILCGIIAQSPIKSVKTAKLTSI